MACLSRITSAFTKRGKTNKFKKKDDENVGKNYLNKKFNSVKRRMMKTT